MGQHTVIRYHDFCAGHRVVGHESKCRHLHGHNYRVHFHVRVRKGLERTEHELDGVGRVIDFSVVKEKLCNWLEENWDHKFLHWDQDKLVGTVIKAFECEHIDMGDEVLIPGIQDANHALDSFVELPFNPTAENMAWHLVECVGPIALDGTDVELYGVELEETRKCSVSYFKD
ncbi:MAG: putative 6-carboxy-5 6 7 8-tetrahydropterin synthase [Prokaryotic dsDNA virus sp.]|nr:MAG: putative 6-carboxy-5 6 7 8-tetrahydropterin synthase [Prokaryotic dsDNA virus sp.]|tara:strand:+ start:28169 stop:28687 length:519 start_codon:yes stop_codon:yes gene_type:complete